MFFELGSLPLASASWVLRLTACTPTPVQIQASTTQVDLNLSIGENRIQIWWLMSVVPALRSRRQENHDRPGLPSKFQASLDYRGEFLEKQTNKKMGGGWRRKEPSFKRVLLGIISAIGRQEYGVARV